MKLKNSKRAISILVFCGLFVGAAYVVASDGVTALLSTTIAITGPDSVCRKITNVSSTGLSEYVPTASVAEWQSFITKPPLGVTLATCTCNIPWGGTLAEGSSVTAYLVPSASACTSQSRLCSNGVLSGSYTYASCAATCIVPWGATITSGSSVTAYLAANAATCTSESRTCTNGSLSGSYTNASCLATCALPWGGSINSGSSVTAYLAANATACSSQTRTCTNGALSGSYANKACAVSCTLPWGGTINSGTSVTAYQVSSVTSPSTCPSQTRSCSSGTLSGTYTYQTCTVNACTAKACVSDARLKRDVATLADSQGLEAILKLRPVTFRWNDAQQDAAFGPQIGFIAQEVQTIFPQVVSTSESSMDIKLQDGTTRHILNPKAVSYGYLAAPLVKAVQQLQAQIDSLKLQNASLELRIAKLEQLFQK